MWFSVDLNEAAIGHQALEQTALVERHHGVALGMQDRSDDGGTPCENETCDRWVASQEKFASSRGIHLRQIFILEASEL
jgi:hypothetical protein